MLWVPPTSQDFTWWTSNVIGVRPATNYGATITPGASNAKGSYAQVLAALARDVFGLLINFNSNGVSAAIRNTLADVGVDPAGGTSYSVLIPDLLLAGASTYDTGANGIWYYFPIWIRAGSTVAVRAQVNNATAGSFRCHMKALGSPRDRQGVRVGTFVRSFGVTAATSSGTAIVSGTTSEGAWTQIGSATADPLWWWQLGFGVADTTMTALVYNADLSVGTATNKTIVAEDVPIASTSTEAVSSTPQRDQSMYMTQSGQNVYARIQCSGTPDSTLSVAAYGLGG